MKNSNEAIVYVIKRSDELSEQTGKNYSVRCRIWPSGVKHVRARSIDDAFFIAMNRNRKQFRITDTYIAPSESRAEIKVQFVDKSISVETPDVNPSGERY